MLNHGRPEDNTGSTEAASIRRYSYQSARLDMLMGGALFLAVVYFRCPNY